MLQYGKISVLDLNWEFTDVNIKDIKKKKSNYISSQNCKMSTLNKFKSSMQF